MPRGGLSTIGGSRISFTQGDLPDVRISEMKLALTVGIVLVASVLSACSSSMTAVAPVQVSTVTFRGYPHAADLIVTRMDMSPTVTAGQRIQYKDISTAQTVAQLLDAAGQLPESPTGILNCPAQYSVKYELSFQYSGGVVLALEVWPSGCLLVHVNSVGTAPPSVSTHLPLSNSMLRANQTFLAELQTALNLPDCQFTGRGEASTPPSCAVPTWTADNSSP
jgi:hypothetical protein